MKEPKVCPKCYGEDIGDRWTKGRMLEYYCRDCHWHAEPRTPESIPITNQCDLRIDNFHGWHYIIYDKYGHVSVDSATHGTKEEAMKDLEWHMTPKRSFPDPAAPYTAVLFYVPPRVQITGIAFRYEDGAVKQVKI